MAKHFINKEEFNARLKQAQSNKKPYNIILQGNSRTLEFENGLSYYTYSLTKTSKGKKDKKTDRLPSSEIYFIGVVKRHILDKGLQKSIPKNYTNKDRIKFISYNENIGAGEYFDDCYCIDITGAYWKSAYNQGYITKSLFEKGLTMDKRVRLACLGTFAKTVSTLHFDGNKEVFLPDIKPKFEHIFFNSANLIYKCMNACRKAVKEDFLFYWTDCVYVKGTDALERCYDVMKEHGFDSHSDYCKQIRFEGGGIRVNKWNKVKERFEDKFYGVLID